MEKSQYGRRDRLVKEKRHDTYKEDKKWPEPTACTECNSVYLEGRWTWYEPPVNANKVLCPACQRISENYPAGYLELKGSFFRNIDKRCSILFTTKKNWKNPHIHWKESWPCKRKMNSS